MYILKSLYFQRLELNINNLALYLQKWENMQQIRLKRLQKEGSKKEKNRSHATENSTQQEHQTAKSACVATSMYSSLPSFLLPFLNQGATTTKPFGVRLWQSLPIFHSQIPLMSHVLNGWISFPIPPTSKFVWFQDLQHPDKHWTYLSQETLNCLANVVSLVTDLTNGKSHRKYNRHPMGLLCPCSNQ